MSWSRRFRHVAVLMGGPSAEREVSLGSGRAVARGLRECGYEVDEVELPGRDVALPSGVEAVFIAMHGAFGEDGELQRILEQRGIPYTASGPDASRLAMDKVRSKELFAAAGIPTPAYCTLRGADEPRLLPLPVVVKPPSQGSTIGCSVVLRESDWPAALRDALRYEPVALVESYIPGRELTVGVLGGEALPVVEIVAPDGFYDYRAKYTKGLTRYLVPAPLDEPVAARCRRVAEEVFGALGCRGMGRVDLRLSPAGEPFVLELNSIPGFTETSLMPKAAVAAGIAFPDLCGRIMEMACTDATAGERARTGR